MSVLIFSHEQDVDGLFSAAILRMAFPESEVVLTNYGLANMLSIGDKITSFVKVNRAGTIIIGDIGVNEESYMPVFEALSISKEKGFTNIWIDHHIWPEGMKSKFAAVCEMVIHYESSSNNGTGKKCTAQICTEKFIPANPLAKTLATIARRTDFPDSTRFPIPPLTGLISYYLGNPALRHKLYSVILHNVTQGILWNAEMQEDMIEASRLIDESISKSMEAKVVKEFRYVLPLAQQSEIKIKVAIAKADSFVSRSILLGRVMDETEIDLAIAYTEDGKVSIRRKDSHSDSILLNCSKIAGQFKEGGGHAGAAGGFLRSNVHENGEAAVIEIVDTLDNYFKSVIEHEGSMVHASGALNPGGKT